VETDVELEVVASGPPPSPLKTTTFEPQPRTTRADAAAAIVEEGKRRESVLT